MYEWIPWKVECCITNFPLKWALVVKDTWSLPSLRTLIADGYKFPEYAKKKYLTNACNTYQTIIWYNLSKIFGVSYFRHFKIMKSKQHINVPLRSTFEGDTMPFLHMMPVLYTKVRGRFIWWSWWNHAPGTEGEYRT